jgi:hypothetical protein
LNAGAGWAIGAFGGAPHVTEQQPRRSEARGDQLFQPQCGGRLAAWKLRHEGDSRLFHAILEPLRLCQIEFQRRRTIHGLTCVTRRQNGKATVPLRRQHENRVHIITLGQRAKAIDRLGAEIVGRLFGAHRNLFADGAHVEAIAQGAQRRTVTHFPGAAEADQADA